jgi:hypothetical protein
VGLDRSLRPLQRFWCSSCRSTFTHARKTARPRARFADDVVEEAVRVYVQGLSSYRVLASVLEHRLEKPVSRVALNSWAQELGARAKTPLEVSAELSPRWGGFLGVDGKAIYVRGRSTASSSESTIPLRISCTRSCSNPRAPRATRAW